jgi:hypothetical protein
LPTTEVLYKPTCATAVHRVARRLDHRVHALQLGVLHQRDAREESGLGLLQVGKVGRRESIPGLSLSAARSKDLMLATSSFYRPEIKVKEEREVCLPPSREVQR